LTHQILPHILSNRKINLLSVALQYLFSIGVVFSVKACIMDFFCAHNRQLPLFYASFPAFAVNPAPNGDVLSKGHGRC
jgi:hypothetical protein